MRAISPYALRWLAAAGAAGAFVVGISAQAVRGHATPPAGAGGDGVGAAISDLGPASAPPGAPGLLAVSLPSMISPPKPRHHRVVPAATPAPVLVAATPVPSATPVPAATPAPVVSAPPVVTTPPPPPAPKPSAPAKGPSFDSSG
jgi:hypothetical protein